ncbi:GerAB/ArcD/ProY family transporter [Brevibacillus dissolubilis]|uniref:GerAB/ArcD/ProY family transporter n=1 Tax=Brevibacillus dissolubilis TaxID=1844116 RepID=UPI0011178877|nr:endospore germination permease [Brevibacillus dissolubilis]
MRTYAMNEITLMQYILLVHGAQVGTGILSLPRQLAETSGTDGWMCIIIAWAINCLAGTLMLLSARKYPDFTIIDLFNYLFGKWFGKLLIFPLICYFGFFGIDIMTNTMLYIKAWFLPKTPEYVIILLFAIPSFLIVRNGLRIQARYVVLSFFMMLWMPFFLLFSMDSWNVLHLLPLFKEGWGPVIQGVPKTIFAYTGIEVVFFIYPFLQKKQYAIHGFLIGNSLTMLYYLYVTLVSFLFFTPDGITSVNQPVLSLLKNIEFRFLERFDMIFLSLYLFVVSKCWMIFIYCTVYSTSRLLNKQDHTSHAALYFLLAIAVIYVVKPTWNIADEWQTTLSYLGTVVLYVLPVGLYLYIRGFERFHRVKTR